MKIQPIRSVEEFHEWEQQEDERQKEALRAFMEREKAIKRIGLPHIFGYACASVALVLFAYKAIEWLKIAYAGWSW